MSEKNPNWHPSEHELWAALCNFCNNAGDPFEPASQWDESVWDNLRRLSKAYNEWHIYMKQTKGDTHIWDKNP